MGRSPAASPLPQGRGRRRVGLGDNVVTGFTSQLLDHLLHARRRLAAQPGIDLGPPPDRADAASRLDEAKAFLRNALADGPRPASEVKEEAKEAGIAEETLRRAREALCRRWRAKGAKYRSVWALNAAGTDEQPEQDEQVPLLPAS